MEFDWDDKKATQNARKHHVSFEEAETVFRDSLMKVRYDSGHSQNEDRYIAIGLSDKGRLLLVSYTYRDHEIGVPFERIRIISARMASLKQEHDYG